MSNITTSSSWTEEDTIVLIKKSFEVTTLDDSDDEEDKKPSAATNVTSTLPVRCPLGLCRIKVPAKARTCKHLPCFDLLTYLSFNQRPGKSRWKCGVCHNPILPSDIIVDPFLSKIVAMLHTDDEIEEVHIRPDGTWSIAAPGGESEKEDGEEEDHPAKVKTSLSEDCKDTAASRTGLGSTPLEHTDSSSLQALGNGSAGTSGAGQAAPTHDVIDLCLSSDEDEPAPPVPSRVAAPIPPVPTRVAAPTVARLPVRPAPAQATVPAVTRPPPKVAAAVPPTQPTKPATARPSTPLPVRTPSTQQKPAARQATSDSDAEDFQNVHWKRKKNVVMSSSSSEGGLESGSETEDESRKVSSNLAPSNRVDSGSNARLQRSLRQRRPVNYADPDDFSDDDLEQRPGAAFNSSSKAPQKRARDTESSETERRGAVAAGSTVPAQEPMRATPSSGVPFNHFSTGGSGDSFLEALAQFTRGISRN